MGHERPIMSPVMHISSAGSAPGVGFDDPLVLLAQCHRRVEQQCATLTRLVPHLIQHGSDEAAREAAAAVLRYFCSAAVLHHADEEQDLLPALLESVGGSDASCLRDMAERLLSDHDRLAVRWAPLRQALTRIAAGETLTLDASQVAEFGRLYAEHIAFEESQLLPMAQRLLSAQALQAMGTAMRERRSPGP